MPSFVSSAGRKAGDIRAFLKAAAGTSSLKYKAQPRTNHSIYFPSVKAQVQDDDGNLVEMDQLVAVSGDIHEWTDSDGRYRSTICTKGHVIKDDNGNVINDGSCPFCDRIQDGWAIYRWRMDLEEHTCTKTGKERETHMDAQKQTFLKERKASEPRPYIYILVVQFRTAPNPSGSGTQPVMGKDGLPEYDLKVMKLSAKRVGDIEAQITNSGLPGLPGAEVIIDYPDTEDARRLVLDSRVSPVFPDYSMLKRFPGLDERIRADVAKFDMDQIEKAFSEWVGMSTAEAQKTTTQLFENWDKFQEELKVNPGARYMEYGGAMQGPAIGAPMAGQLPAAGAGMGVSAGLPAGVPAGQPTFVVPGGLPDVNQVFGGQAATAPAAAPAPAAPATAAPAAPASAPAAPAYVPPAPATPPVATPGGLGDIPGGGVSI